MVWQASARAVAPMERDAPFKLWAELIASLRLPLFTASVISETRRSRLWSYAVKISKRMPSSLPRFSTSFSKSSEGREEWLLKKTRGFAGAGAATGSSCMDG
jgi:hypothetical protein